MRTTHSSVDIADYKPLSIIKEELNAFVGKTVIVCSREGVQKGNQKILSFEGTLLSVSSNIFSINMSLGKSGHLVKSFSLNDISIHKIIVKEKEC